MVITDGWTGYPGLTTIVHVHDRRSRRATRARSGNPGGLRSGVHPVYRGRSCCPIARAPEGRLVPSVTRPGRTVPAPIAPGGTLPPPHVRSGGEPYGNRLPGPAHHRNHDPIKVTT